MGIEVEIRNSRFLGNEREECNEFLGIRYAKAERFRYAEEIQEYKEEVDATKYGAACPQYRQFFPHLDVPERKFYHREFRDGLSFTYDEDCLNLNIYTPKEKGNYPVLFYVHGGGFNSMCNSESYLDGASYAKRGIVLVVINYRVGVFGYLSDESIQKENGRDGNFGLDDIVVALHWVKHNIASFGGDPDNITVMGQSAGAISLQLLCLNHKMEDLFQRAILMSGAGCLPSFALPKKAEETHEYWQDVIGESKADSFESFRKLDVHDVLEAVEKVKEKRKDNQRNTMPVVDGYLLEDAVDKLFKNPLNIPYIIGYTSCDMFAIIWANMATKFSKQVNGYLYLFDVDAPGDNNLAFHSSDLRYAFGTLDKSWRPYDEEDKKVSELMLDYFASFIQNGNPNGDNRPEWIPGKKPLMIQKKVTKMKNRPFFRLLKNTLKGDPK